MNGSQLRTSLVGIVLLMAMAGCGGSMAAGVASPSPPEGQVGGWEALPASPLSPRTEAHAFWTGERVLLIGGSDARPCPPGADCALPAEPSLSDGATFDPSTDTWQEIARAPRPLGDLSGAVVSDTLYVWLAAQPGEGQALLTYDLGNDRWTELELPHEAQGDSRVLVPAGDRLAAYSPTQERGVRADLLYDPATGDWAEVAADPQAPSFDRTMVWTGKGLVQLGIAVVAEPNGSRPSLYRAAILDLASGEWRRLPDSEVVASNPAWFWSAGRIINPTIGSADGGEVGNWGRSFPFGGALDPEIGAWSPLPDPPAPMDTYMGISVGGAEHVVSTEGFVLHVPSESWVPLPRPASAAEAGAASVWAGDRLFVWGGVRWIGGVPALLSQGWEWRP